MTELRSKTLDVRTATLDVPGMSLAYDLRDAECESNRAVLLMISAPMDASGSPRPNSIAGSGPVVTYVINEYLREDESQ
jgi:hypothetical protein